MNNTGKSVLIAEKDTGIANMIRAILGIVGVGVVHVQSVADAEDALETEDIGLIISDKDVNGGGYELLSIVREREKTKQIPVIMMVRSDDKSHEKMAENKRADKYILKPFTARAVLDIVKEFIVYKDQ